jgi:DNA-binding MarR family transcriptional regulator
MARPRRKQSTVLFAWREALRTSSLTSTQRGVAWALSQHMDRNGGSCFPSVQTLSEDSGYSRRTVQKTVRSLEGVGWIECDAGGGRKRTTRYQARIPGVEAIVIESQHKMGRVNSDLKRAELFIKTHGHHYTSYELVSELGGRFANLTDEEVNELVDAFAREAA